MVLDIPGTHPRAFMEMILSSKSGQCVWYLRISMGSKELSRSRGISTDRLPLSSLSVLVFLPLGELLGSCRLAHASRSRDDR